MNHPLDEVARLSKSYTLRKIIRSLISKELIFKKDSEYSTIYLELLVEHLVYLQTEEINNMIKELEDLRNQTDPHKFFPSFFKTRVGKTVESAHKCLIRLLLEKGIQVITLQDLEEKQNTFKKSRLHQLLNECHERGFLIKKQPQPKGEYVYQLKPPNVIISEEIQKLQDRLKLINREGFKESISSEEVFNLFKNNYDSVLT